MRFQVALCVLPLLFSLVLSAPAASHALPRLQVSGDLVQKVVVRTIEASNSLIRSSVRIKFENKGSSTATEFAFILPNDQASRLALLEPSQKKTVLPVSGPFSIDLQPDFVAFKVSGIKISPSETQEVTVKLSFTGRLRPEPELTPQESLQYVILSDSHLVASPYKTEKQSTRIKLGTDRVESYSELKPMSFADRELSLGPYADVAPFSVSSLQVHYAMQAGLVDIEELVRTVEVSHWGYVSFTDDYRVRNNGAGLKGEFSRLDYVRKQAFGNSIASMDVNIPYSAVDMYYRDEIGNISTSNLFRYDDHIHAQLMPRFPLFGHWQTVFTFGHAVPLNVLGSYTESGKRQVVFSLWPGMENVGLKKMTLKIMLPEGATGISTMVPYSTYKDVDIRQESVATYLDVGAGRPTVVITIESLTPEMDSLVQITYDFAAISMLREPLLLIFAFFVLLAVGICGSRLSLKIKND
eukprot:ANDGO_07133.mRNA.1 Dolichyl-diphosphooligosaccharide--protein glycosyltransferase subunit 1A